MGVFNGTGKPIEFDWGSKRKAKKITKKVVHRNRKKCKK